MKLFIFLNSDKIDVVAPLVDHRGHILRNPGIKLDPFSGARVDEAKCFGVKSLPWTDLKAVLDELAVLGVNRALADFRATIPFVIEQRMADVAHVNPDLVRAPGFQPALDNRHIAKSFQHLIVCHGVLAALIITGIDLETKPVVGVASDVAVNRPLILLDVAPDNGHVPPLDGVLEELAGEIQLRLVVFRHDKEA